MFVRIAWILDNLGFESGLGCLHVCLKCCWWRGSSEGERWVRSSLRMLEEKSEYPMGTYNLSRLSLVDVGLYSVDGA